MTYTKDFAKINRISRQKLKSLMLDDPELTPLATQKRRTYLPAEVNIIYQHLGRP